MYLSWNTAAKTPSRLNQPKGPLLQSLVISHLAQKQPLTARWLYSWVVVPPFSSPVQLGVAALVVPPLAAVPGFVYNATLKVRDTQTGEANQRTFMLEPLHSPLRLFTEGPVGNVSVNNPVSIQAKCTDPDGGNVTYSWNCTGNCSDSVLRAVSQTSNSSLTISLGWSTGSPSFVVTAICTSSLGARSVSRTVSLTGVQYQLPRVSVSGPASTQTTSSLLLEAKAEGGTPTSYAWSCDDPCGLDLEKVELSPLGSHTNRLLLLANTLRPGLDVIFRVAVGFGSDTVKVMTVVLVESGPRGGTVTSSLVEATGLDRITVEAASWVADLESYPLEYALYGIDEAMNAVPLSLYSPTQSITAFLPDVAKPTVYELQLRVRDRRGNVAEARTAIMIHPAERSRLFMVEDIALSLREGNTELALAAFLAASSQEVSSKLIEIVTALSPTAHNAEQYAALACSVASQGSASSIGVIAAAATLVSGVIGVASSDALQLSLRALGSIAASLTCQANQTSAALSDQSQLMVITNTMQNVSLAIAELREIAVALFASTLQAGESRELLSDTLESVCSRASEEQSVVTLQTSSFSVKVDTQQATDAGKSLILCASKWASNPFDSYCDVATLSDVTGINILSVNSDGVVQYETSTAVDFLLQTAAGATASPQCSFFNTSSLHFESGGCAVVSEAAEYVTCHCNHLTEFVIAHSSAMRPQQEGTPLAFAIMGSMTATAIVGVIVGWIVDCAQQRHFYGSQSKAASEAKSSYTASGEHEYCAVTPIKTTLQQKHWWTFLQWHPLSAIFFADAISSYTIPQRVLVLSCEVSVVFASSAIALQVLKVKFGLSFFVGFCMSFPIVAAVNTVLPLFFKRVQRRRSSASTAEKYAAGAERVIQATEPTKEGPLTRRSSTLLGCVRCSSFVTSKLQAMSSGSPLRAHSQARLTDPALKEPSDPFTDQEGSAAAKKASQSKSVNEIHAMVENNHLNSISLSRARIKEVCISLTLRKHYLSSTTVCALDMAMDLTSIYGVSDDSPKKATETKSFASRIAALLSLPLKDAEPEPFGIAVENAASRDPRPAPDIPDTAMLLSCALQQQTECDTLIPAVVMRRTNAAVEQRVYACEMHCVCWRLAIECIKVQDPQLMLAEVLFVLHVLIDCPDLFFVLFSRPPPLTISEVVCVVVEYAMGDPPEGALMNPGRLWGTFYGYYLRKLDAASYENLRAKSETPTSNAVCALLGLCGTEPFALRVGCVPYSLRMEEANEVPSVRTALDHLSESPVHNLVLVSHVFRLATKPNLDQRWEVSSADLIERAMWSDVNSIPTSARCSVEETNRLLHVGEGRSAAYLPTQLNRALSALSDEAAERTDFVKDPHLRCAYAASSATAPSCVLTAIDKCCVGKEWKEKLQTVVMTHNNFYATIECGRLMTLLEALDRDMTLAEWGEEYMRELDALRLLADSTSLQLALDDSNKWIGDGKRRRDEACGVNAFTPHDATPSDPCLLRLLNGCTRGCMRYVSPGATPSLPLTQLAKLHPVNCQGTGTQHCPHLSVASGVCASGVGDQVEIMAGKYTNICLRGCHGTFNSPLILAPRNYMLTLNRDEETNKEGEASKQCEEHNGAGVAQPEKACDDVFIESSMDEPPLRFEDCSHIHVLGAYVKTENVAVVSRRSIDCNLGDCDVTCQQLYRTDTDNVPVPADANLVHLAGAPSSPCTPVDGPRLSWQYAILGYVVAAGLLAVCAIGAALFESTRRVSSSDVWEWVASACVTLLIVFVGLCCTALWKEMASRRKQLMQLWNDFRLR